MHRSPLDPCTQARHANCLQLMFVMSRTPYNYHPICSSPEAPHDAWAFERSMVQLPDAAGEHNRVTTSSYRPGGPRCWPWWIKTKHVRWIMLTMEILWPVRQ